MAAVIHDLWARNDASLLILPCSVGLDAPGVRDELTRYLPEGWTPVLEGDVDGRNSGPFRIDAESPRFGQTVAARRVARAIFLGSAPHVAAQRVRGVEDVRIRLGAVQPGEQVAVFNDALSQLSERLTYLYRQDRRYWYDTRPNLRRTVSERAQQLAEDEVEREIERRLREATRRDRGGFQGVHPCPAVSADVPDEPAVRLVVLAPGAAHADGDTGSAALTTARDLLSERGSSPRRHQNMLAFLAPDREAVEGLVQEARRFLAWKSVVRDREALNLDAHQRREAAEGEKASDDTGRLRLNEAWRWLLVPVQHVLPDGVGGLAWEVVQAPGGGGDPIAARAWQRMRSNEHVIPEWSPTVLAMELERWFWWSRPHVPVKQVWDAMCAYCYLPRLRDESVFTASIRAGLASGDYFAYATSVSAQGRYEGLTFGVSATARKGGVAQDQAEGPTFDVPAAAAVYVDAASVLVRPEAARAQLEAERARSAEASGTGAEAATLAGMSGARTGTGTGLAGSGEASGRPLPADGTGPVGRPVEPPPPRRFFGTVRLDPDRAGRDMSTVAEEVLQHLPTLPGAEVEVSVEISAKVPAGVDRTVRRIVEENCRTLRFRSHGFEEE